MRNRFTVIIHRFTINAPGLGKIEVEIELICECQCEKSGAANSTICTSQGTYKCGICYCNPGRYGENCQCGEEEQADDSLCRQANATETDAVCSSSGSCICGKCECNKRNVSLSSNIWNIFIYYHILYTL